MSRIQNISRVIHCKHFWNQTNVNDLPKTVNDKTVPILFAGDTNVTVKSPNSRDFQTNMVRAFNCVNKWFKG
jgi:hypothetical protein